MPYRNQWGQLLRGSLQECVAFALDTIQKEKPEVIVGSSLGGAVALRLDTATPLVLLAPAIRASPRGILETWANRRRPQLARVLRWLPEFSIKVVSVKNLPARTVILHCRNDTWVPFKTSWDLLRRFPGSSGPDNPEITKTIETIELGVLNWDSNRTACQPGRLVGTGQDHRLSDSASLDLMDQAVRLVTN